MNNINAINLKSVETKLNEIVNEVHPFYNEKSLDVRRYDEQNIIKVGVNYDYYGYFSINEDGTFNTTTSFRFGVSSSRNNVPTMREAIKYLVREYFH